MAHELIHFVVFSLGQFESMSQIGELRVRVLRAVEPKHKAIEYIYMAHELIHFVVFSLEQFESMSQIGDFAFEFFESLNQHQ